MPLHVHISPLFYPGLLVLTGGYGIVFPMSSEVGILAQMYKIPPAYMEYFGGILLFLRPDFMFRLFPDILQS